MTTTPENLGPAEHIINALLAFSDHMYHGRPGIVTTDARTTTGSKWAPVTHRVEEGVKVVYGLSKVGRRTVQTRLGVLMDDGKVRVREDRRSRVVGEYRKPGIYPEVAEWFYAQVAAVWNLDNEFAAKWASYAFGEEHRDLKCVLAAFMLVQSRKGAPEKTDEGEVLFYDEDYRDVGEAMVLTQRKGSDLTPKALLRMYDVLTLPGVAKINYDLGFTQSDRNPFLGRWPGAVRKWLRYREENPRMLEGLVNAAFRTTVVDLARKVGYKPISSKFFETLRWKQKQAQDGRRTMAIGAELRQAESWAGLSEKEVCARIVEERPNWKRIVSLLPSDVGVTRAVTVAAISAKCLSDKDLVILTPTLEQLGLLDVQDVKDRWLRAVNNAKDMRAASVAKNTRSQAVKDALETGADKAAKVAVAEAVKGLRTYVLVDISGSMEQSIEKAKVMVAKFVQAMPADQVHVCVFNTHGRVIEIKHASTRGVEAAFRGVRSSGGTDYGAGVRCIGNLPPKDDEDSLFIFVGDEQAVTFSRAVQASGLRPAAFGLLRIQGGYGMSRTAVQSTATSLGVPCFMIDENTFDDVYAIPRTLRNLIAATPVSTNPSRKSVRKTIVTQILETKLLEKPAWA